MVKTEYRRLAKEAFNIHSELSPKTFSPPRKRREKWNIISFESTEDYDKHCSHVNTPKEDNLPGFFSWNSRCTSEPWIEQVTFPSLTSSISSSDIKNDVRFRGYYDPTIKLSPILLSSERNHSGHESLPKLSVSPVKPRISSKIQLLLNDD